MYACVLLGKIIAGEHHETETHHINKTMTKRRTLQHLSIYYFWKKAASSDGGQAHYRCSFLFCIEDQVAFLMAALSFVYDLSSHPHKVPVRIDRRPFMKKSFRCLRSASIWCTSYCSSIYGLLHPGSEFHSAAK